MFTVKVQHADGREELHSAKAILNIPACNGPADANWDKAGLYLDPDPLPSPGRNINDCMMGAREIILFGGDHTAEAQARKGGKVWVMNAQGATVATYDL
jgi:hypothetical protein